MEFVDRALDVARWHEIDGLTYRATDGRIVENPGRPAITDLDSLPFPDKTPLDLMRRDLDSGLYYINIVAGRGCFGRCTFCSTGQLSRLRQRRARTPLNVVDEMEQNVQRHGVKYFKFVDEIFVFPNHHAWIEQFCAEIERRRLDIRFHVELRADCVDAAAIRRLAQVGLDEVFVGAESGSDAVLARLGKGTSVAHNDAAIAVLKQHGVRAQLGFIMFEPEMTRQELRANIVWLLRSGCHTRHNICNRLNVYRGSLVESRLVDAGLISHLGPAERHSYSFRDSVVGRTAGLVSWANELFRPLFVEINTSVRAMARSGHPDWRRVLNRIEEQQLSTWRKILLAAYWTSARSREDLSFRATVRGLLQASLPEVGQCLSHPSRSLSDEPIAFVR